MHSWRHVTECDDDDDLPSGWGDDPDEEEDSPPSSTQANGMDAHGSEGSCMPHCAAAEPRLNRRPLPSLFTHVPVPPSSATVSGKGNARPPRPPPSQYQPLWTIRERRARSQDVPPRRRVDLRPNQIPEDDEQRASSEGARQARAALEQLRASKHCAPLEDTLDRLKSLERVVKAQKENAKALGASLPPLPRESIGRGRRTMADARSIPVSAATTTRRSSQSGARSGSRTPLPELERKHRGRSASAPAATQGLRLASLVVNAPAGAPTRSMHGECTLHEDVTEVD